MKHIYFAITLFSSLSLLSCKNEKSREHISRPDLPEEVRPVAEAIENADPSQFAAVVSYPIQRPYPLRDVSDSSGMVSYFNKIVDAPLKKMVHEAPDSAWHQEGWRGWALGDENFFFIDEGKIYEMNYISETETQLLDSLRNVEISSLNPSLRKNWQPVACISDSISGTIFRIDSRNDTVPPIYRLAGYSSGTDLSGQPSIILYGSLELEGSMGTRFYKFSDEEGNKAEYTPDVFEDEDTPQLELDIKGKATKYKAKPDYWLDHIKQYKRKMRGR